MMCVCVYIYIYIYIYIYTHTHTYILDDFSSSLSGMCAHVYCVDVLERVSTHVPIHTYMYLLIHACICSYIHVLTHTYMYLLIHTCTYLYMHVFTHTHMPET
jgi:hypothetical protein